MPGIYQPRRRERQVQKLEAGGQGGSCCVLHPLPTGNPSLDKQPSLFLKAFQSPVLETLTPPLLPRGEVCRECVGYGYSLESHHHMSRRKGPGGEVKGTKFGAWHMEESVRKQGCRSRQGPGPVRS